MPTDQQARRPLTAWLLPVATFVAGALIAVLMIPKPAPPPPAPAVPTFGAGSTGAPQNSAIQGELALMRDINGKFVDQLRQYETRLRSIAATAEKEGAPEAAEAMQDFALETEILIDRYDLILKEN